MNDVATNQQWNAKAAFLDGDALECIGRGDIDLIEDRPDLTGAQSLRKVVQGRTIAGIALAHLANFLGHSHALEEYADALLDQAWINHATGFWRGHGWFRLDGFFSND
jgi:hypothetical protein